MTGYVSTWQAAETNAANWIRSWGWSDARVTGTGPDGGIDVMGRGVVAQVKFKSSQTGAPDIQRLMGASYRHQGAQLIFFSGSSFSSKAIEIANEANVALFTYDLMGQVTAANGMARAITRRVAVQATGTRVPRQAAATGRFIRSQPTRSISATEVARGILYSMIALAFLFMAIATLVEFVAGEEKGQLGIAIAVLIFGAPGVRIAWAAVKAFNRNTH